MSDHTVVAVSEQGPPSKVLPLTLWMVQVLAAAGSWVTFGTATGEVFLSADEGQHWENVAKELPPVRCVAFA